MPTVAQFVDHVDGVREGVADAIAARYDSVAELADASSTDLQEVKGVGPVLADRILASARAEAATSTGAHASAGDRGPVAEATRAARPVLDVVEDTAGDVSRGRRVAVDADDELPSVVVRLATLVGTTVGWTIRAYRTVTTPVARLLSRA